MKKWKARAYQFLAFCKIVANAKFALFLDPGLGKTSTTLAGINVLLKLKKTKGVLLIAPVRVIYGVWPEEIKKWSNFSHISHCNLNADISNIWSKSDIYLINPESLFKLHKELLQGLNSGKSLNFDMLVIDESTKFSAYNTNRFQYMTDMLCLFRRRLILTGTPAASSLMGLWSQIYLLDEGKALGVNFHRFRQTYFEKSEYCKHTWFCKEDTKDEIYRKIAPMVLDMKAEEHIDMPELVINDIFVRLKPKAMKIYKEMERELFTEVDECGVLAKTSTQKRLICHQMANGRFYEPIPENLDDDEVKIFKKNRKVIKLHEEKLDATEDLIAELHGKPILIGYHYKHDYQALTERLGDVAHIGAGVTGKQLTDTLEAWNAGEIPILVAHPRSMAHGLNMQQSCVNLLFYSLADSTEDYLQFVARIYRQGNDGDTVTVHRLISKGTVDEAIIRTNTSGQEQQTTLRVALRKYHARLS